LKGALAKLDLIRTDLSKSDLRIQRQKTFSQLKVANIKNEHLRNFKVENKANNFLLGPLKLMTSVTKYKLASSSDEIDAG